MLPSLRQIIRRLMNVPDTTKKPQKVAGRGEEISLASCPLRLIMKERPTQTSNHEPCATIGVNFTGISPRLPLVGEPPLGEEPLHERGKNSKRNSRVRCNCRAGRVASFFGPCRETIASQPDTPTGMKVSDIEASSRRPAFDFARETNKAEQD